jgi:hypothetical protein
MERDALAVANSQRAYSWGAGVGFSASCVPGRPDGSCVSLGSVVAVRALSTTGLRHFLPCGPAPDTAAHSRAAAAIYCTFAKCRAGRSSFALDADHEAHSRRTLSHPATPRHPTQPYEPCPRRSRAEPYVPVGDKRRHWRAIGCGLRECFQHPGRPWHRWEPGEPAEAFEALPVLV